MSIKDIILHKLGLKKKENQKELVKHIEEMDSDELMETVISANQYIKRLENKNGDLYNDLNICFCDYKSKSNFLDGDTVEKIDPWLEDILKEVSIEYYKHVALRASAELKGRL